MASTAGGPSSDASLFLNERSPCAGRPKTRHCQIYMNFDRWRVGDPRFNIRSKCDRHSKGCNHYPNDLLQEYQTRKDFIWAPINLIVFLVLWIREGFQTSCVYYFWWIKSLDACSWAELIEIYMWCDISLIEQYLTRTETKVFPNPECVVRFVGELWWVVTASKIIRNFKHRNECKIVFMIFFYKPSTQTDSLKTNAVFSSIIIQRSCYSKM